MKKLLLLIPAVFLIAAGCNKTSNTSYPNSLQQQTNQSGTQSNQSSTITPKSSNTQFTETPSLEMTQGTYSLQRAILTAIDIYYGDNKKLPKKYNDLVTAGLLTYSQSDISFLSYLQYNYISDKQIDVCLKFKVDPNTGHTQCKSYVAGQSNGN